MDAVRSERKGGVLVLTLDRPDKYNAFDVPMARELHAKVRSAAKDPDVGCVVLTGAGKAFCAGGDAAAMLDAADKDPAALFRALTQQLHPTIKLLVTMEKPAIAAVNGAVAGGGYGLALACDLRYAAPSAKFKAAYFGLGVVPDGGSTWLLPRIVGEAKARELMLTDQTVAADRALALGLVHRVVPLEQLLPEALAQADQLARGPRFAIGKAKRLFAQSGTATLEEQLDAERKWNAQSASRPDFQEGVRAFQEKRPPRFGAGPQG